MSEPTHERPETPQSPDTDSEADEWRGTDLDDTGQPLEATEADDSPAEPPDEEEG
jgi:hypothetical protein